MFLFHMKSFYILLLGLFIGLCASWPGIVIPNNWKCFKDIIDKSTKEQISLKAALALSPNYLLKRNNNSKTSKLRIISDACFR